MPYRDDWHARAACTPPDHLTTDEQRRAWHEHWYPDARGYGGRRQKGVRVGTMTEEQRRARELAATAFARQVCAGCPVLDACARDADRTEGLSSTWGVRAGLTATDRLAARRSRQRNAARAAARAAAARDRERTALTARTVGEVWAADAG